MYQQVILGGLIPVILHAQENILIRAHKASILSTVAMHDEIKYRQNQH
jgi:hypothetical protein